VKNWNLSNQKVAINKQRLNFCRLILPPILIFSLNFSLAERSSFELLIHFGKDGLRDPILFGFLAIFQQMRIDQSLIGVKSKFLSI
jgi:hypothetical protein